MGSLTLIIAYEKNKGLVFNSTELKNLVFTGIALQDQFGNPIPEDTINFYIDAAQREVENDLSVKFVRQAYTETKDFVQDDYVQWGYINTLYPAVKAYSVQGFLNTTLQINYPQEWLGTKSQSEEGIWYRSINLVPIAGPSSSIVGNIGLTGTFPYMGLMSNRQLPNFFSLVYFTGFNKVPADILNYISKTAAINLFYNLGDIITGIPGVASKSISIDGLSQNVNTMRGFLNRIESYKKDLERQRQLLHARYGSLTFGAL